MPKSKKPVTKKAEVENVNQPSISRPQVQRGLVTSAKNAKTVTVWIQRSKMHPLYKKAVKRSKRYLVHDEVGVKEGDVVEIVQIRPISKNKNWGILKVVGVDIATIVAEELKEGAAEAIAEVMPVEEVSESVDQQVSESENPKEEIKEKTSKKKKEKK